MNTLYSTSSQSHILSLHHYRCHLHSHCRQHRSRRFRHCCHDRYCISNLLRIRCLPHPTIATVVAASATATAVDATDVATAIDATVKSTREPRDWEQKPLTPFSFRVPFLGVSEYYRGVFHASRYSTFFIRHLSLSQIVGEKNSNTFSSLKIVIVYLII